MLIERITIYEINKIFDNRNTKEQYLHILSKKLSINLPLPKTLKAIDQLIIETWDYKISKDIIRHMFFNSKKFLDGVNCGYEINTLIDDWYNHNLGEIEWPFSAMNFDSYVARLNRDLDLTEEGKDRMIATDAIKFRRIKDINTKRNDFIESLIVRHNPNIIPTFRHTRGVDFYINGEPFDQKVSRSVGKAFIDEYGDNAYNIAINYPHLLAKSLYENQDEERFDDVPRLYVVYLDNNIQSEIIEQCICNTDFNVPMDIEFNYIHSNHEIITHRTNCFVLLLHN